MKIYHFLSKLKNLIAALLYSIEDADKSKRNKRKNKNHTPPPSWGSQI